MRNSAPQTALLLILLVAPAVGQIDPAPKPPTDPSPGPTDPTPKPSGPIPAPQPPVPGPPHSSGYDTP